MLDKNVIGSVPSSEAARSAHRGGWVGVLSLLLSGVTYLLILYMGVSVLELTRALCISEMLGPLRVRLKLLRSQHLRGGKLSLIFRCSFATPNNLLSPSHSGIIFIIRTLSILLSSCHNETATAIFF